MFLTVYAVRSSACKNVYSDLAEDLELQFCLSFFFLLYEPCFNIHISILCFCA